MPKKYFQDHLILLLLSVNVFLAFALVIFVLARLSAGHGNGYIVAYRSSLGINAFQQGGVGDLLSFILFGFVSLGITTVLSLRLYVLERTLAIIALGFCTLLLVLALIISNALLVLH